MNITVEKRGLYQYGLLAKLKQSFMALLFLLTLSTSFQTMASERYMPDKFNTGLQRVEVKDNQLLLTYKLVIGSDYKNITQADIEIGISTHDSTNQNPPPSYPIHKSVSTKLADWQAADGRFYEAFEYTVSVKVEEGAFFINEKLTFKDKEGDVIEERESVHGALMMDDIVVYGNPLKYPVLEDMHYNIDSMLSSYSDQVILKQDPDFFKRKNLVKSAIIDETKKEGKEGYQSKTLDAYKKEYSEYERTENNAYRKAKEEYNRRFLSPQK